MPIDKAIADRVLTRYGYDLNYRRYWEACPCCGHEEDSRGAPDQLSIRPGRLVDPDDGTRYGVHYRCLACGGRWLTLFDDNNVVGFRNRYGR